MAYDDLVPEVRAVLKLDRTIHEPARLAILGILASIEQAEFSYLMAQTGLTQGNLSAHLGKLEAAELVSVDKAFVGKRPRTTLAMTRKGRDALEAHIHQVQGFFGALGHKPDRKRKTGLWRTL